MAAFEDHLNSTEGLLKSHDLVYLKQRRSRWSLFRSWFGSFALGVVTSALIFGIASQSSRLIPKKSYSFADTDLLPNVPYETVTFQADAMFSQRPTDDTDFAWDMLLPPGRGYVFVSDPQSRGLPEGEQTAWGQIYSVSMFHQLHCLAQLRKMYWVFRDGVVTGETTNARTFAGRVSTDHVSHCFDYLRQAIFCSGDMTLEWPKQDGPSSGAVVDGWNIPHTCKSPKSIADFMDEHHFNGSMLFDAAG